LNGLINYAKRFKIPLLSISTNKKGILYNKSTFGIIFKKPIEACPHNLAPTSSTTMTLVLGDAIAITLLKIRGFKQNQFKKIHPGGSIGKDLVKLSDIMHVNKKLPLVKYDEKMSNVLIIMTQKSFGCVGVVNKSKNIIGIITDGDLRRHMSKEIINKTALQVMTKNPKVGYSDTLVGEAINIMNEKKITSLFVCNKKIPIGIVHIHDLLRISS
jgi:arabinose-5-phosphate isomerase